MRRGREAVGEEIEMDRQMDGERDRGREGWGIIGFHTVRDEEGASALLLCSNTPHGCLLAATTLHKHTHTHTRSSESNSGYNKPIERHRLGLPNSK